MYSEQLHLLLHAVLYFGIVVGLAGALCVVLGLQTNLGSGPRVRAVFSEIASAFSRQNFVNWPRATITGILKTLSAVSFSIAILTVLSLLFLPYWFVHLNEMIFRLSAHPSTFDHFRAAVKATRDVWVDCSIIVLVSNGIFGFLYGATGNGERAPALVAVSALASAIITTLVSLYLSLTLVSFYWGYYPVILKASLTGSLSNVLCAQILMFPITLSAISFPVSLLATIVSSLVAALFTRAGESFSEAFARGSATGLRGASWAQSFSAGVSLSFILSVAAVALGTDFAPHTHPAVFIQLLVSNALFDGLTLAVTLTIFRWVLTQSNLALFGRLVLAVGIDLGAAALLAVGSLYFSFVGTPSELHMNELIYVLIGHDPLYPHDWQFGPMFWLMHSSFLPTLLVWIVILSSAMTAVIMSFLETFIDNPARDSKPLVALGTILGAWGIILGGVAYVPI